MGLLDDAIRQHLELKRAHGADEAELQRKENEALGPVRREAEPAADDGGEQPEAQDQAAPEQAPAEEPAAREPVAEEAVPETSVVEEPPAEEPADEERVAFTDDDPFADDEPFAEEAPVAVEETLPPVDEAPPAEEQPAEERRSEDTPTRGFDALSEDTPEPDSAEGEDVLEETPEFLQETPEHDRLWFEQKPPRDFDFDDEK